MNQIRKSPIQSIGYGFIPDQFLPKGKDEYHLRNRQNGTTTEHRRLKAFEIEALVRNNNTSDDWNRILVSESFNPDLVRNCKFFGLVRIGRLEPWYLEYHNLRVPVGLYNSTIISCDLGDNVVIDNVNYLSHYIIGDDVIIVNVNELATTSTAKFGNGIIKDGESESVRIRMEVCNENGGRSILPFDGMLPGDAFLWSKYRDDVQLMEAFERFTERTTDRQRGYYGIIGDRTVVKNCKIIKDVRIGSDAYLKGANKIKNVTINSAPEAMTQVGEGCELVNGVVGYGCRVFYGVKAVRFVMASHSQLKYGARLINAYLGNNATISCCEVLNALIYPFHEQHHNNSFLCAALVMGQSNMAAGATIGSNHNSRANDGELVAGRGFWPGLCVSLKHNSMFASFSILAKGDYESEIRNPFPFSLISQDLSRDRLQVMPAYWFMYNLYGLCRNEWKYKKRDQRTERIQHIETAYLAPDSVNEIMEALTLLAEYTGRAHIGQTNPEGMHDREHAITVGKALLDACDISIDTLEVTVDTIEHSSRKVLLLKVRQAYAMYLRMLRLYGIEGLMNQLQSLEPNDISGVIKAIPFSARRERWTNVGGQLIPTSEVNKLRADIGKYKGWNDIHQFYRRQSDNYQRQRNTHAIACLLELGVIDKKTFDVVRLRSLADEALETKRWIMQGILDSRQKDYENPFRQMVYDTEAEMEQVLGRIDDNAFIQEQQEALMTFTEGISSLLSRLGA
jgi:NDP-sugar pyrophosphorylase family protein